MSRFETLHDPKRMPGQRSDVLNWPYVEGLRMDEAMHPLTLLASGIYGRALPPQDGAPIRLVDSVEIWFQGNQIHRQNKIGGDAAANVVERIWRERIRLLCQRESAGGFIRAGGQATEQRIGESGRRPTLMFNGYAEQVGHLYAGMDLRKNF